MTDVNTTTQGGRLTKDPELKMIGETNKVSFSIASDEPKRKGQDESYTSFFDVELWGRKAEVVAEYFKKGDPIIVEGKLRQDRWPDKDSGEKRSKLFIKASDFYFMPKQKA